MRVLLTGWFSFVHGEATAGDVLAVAAVQQLLDAEKLAYDVAWSPVFRPGALTLDAANPADYTHLIFVCGPLHGPQIADLHVRYAHCSRTAVGVSVIDPADPAVTGFHQVLARDGAGDPVVDLAAAPVIDPVPVVGVILSKPQAEYGGRGRHEDVAPRLTEWLCARGCARVPLDTRLDRLDWRLAADPGQLVSVLRRLDLAVTTRLHGLVLALRSGIPAIAVDPISGGGKVTAQARAWDWPAVLPAEKALPDALGSHWDWCLSPAGRAAARARAEITPESLFKSLLEIVRE